MTLSPCKSPFLNLLLACGLLLASALPLQAAPADDERAQTVVHMLDYVSVDYPQFVRDGQVQNPSEYAEQLEFVSQAGNLLKQLPANPQQPELLRQAEQLHQALTDKAAGPTVSAQADALRLQVIQAYQLTVAPRQAPDANIGARLFQSNCMACHGATGHGDGPAGKDLDPHPSNFHDAERMQARSVYGLYNTITLGVGDTPMRAFSELSEQQRWALAFYVSKLRFSPELLQQGEALWKQGKGKGKAEFSGLRDLVTMAPGAVLEHHGEQLAAVQAYLIANPQALQAGAASPLQITRDKLQQTSQAYAGNQREQARQLAISAYLEGFELVESSLNNVDAPLRAQVEREMMALRGAIANGKPATEVDAQIAKVGGLLDRAEEKLSAGNISATTAFVSSLLILLREGLEAILVLAAIVAFVAKTGRRDALPYIHFGWIAAVVLGGVTWVVANYLITISGSNREMTEGVTAMIAAAMLLYVGYWLHSKSYAQAWQKFIREQVNAALGKQTLWAMALISFLAIYRELFEIILFYEALWVQVGPEGHTALLSGIAVAFVLLALIGWAILKYSVRLPITKFFAWTSSLLALMAVVFVGNGVAALQEAGMLDSDAVNFVSLPLLGVHPTLQGLFGQLAILLLVTAGMLLARRQALRA